MIQHAFCTCAVQIEVGMIGQIYIRGFIGGGLIADNERAVFQRIGDFGRKAAGISLFAVRRRIAANEFWRAAGALRLLNCPDTLVKSFRTAVQMRFAIVSFERIIYAVQRDFPPLIRLAYRPTSAPWHPPFFR